MTRVLIVDDDAMARSSLQAVLTAKGLIVVDAVADGDEVPAAVAKHRPDVVLIDLHMRRTGGIEAIRLLAEQPGAPRSIALTAFGADAVVHAIAAGAAGYLSKNDDPDDLVDHIRAVADGRGALGPDAAAVAIRQLGTSGTRENEARERLTLLTDREQEIVALVGHLSNADIASRLHIALDTVKVDVSRALSKLGLKKRAQLAVLADRAGITATE